MVEVPVEGTLVTEKDWTKETSYSYWSVDMPEGCTRTIENGIVIENTKTDGDPWANQMFTLDGLTLAEGKEYVLAELEKNGYETIPSEGCYVCIKPKYKTSREITDLLEENGILILCGKQGLTGWLRLTIAHKKYMEIFMDALLKLDRE